ncbi:uncharacterized protein [Palaemon carinicauda]|uniref:uncharacterized protein n=1 Tax=Palaemon carinicauda TaxID=392227 RepID=UPI0035B60FD7
MNFHQRNNIYGELTHHEFLEHCCRPYGYGRLPTEMLTAVQNGDLEKTRRYLDTDRDVNATYEEETLLSRACSVGQVEIVILILQCPDVHLNIYFEGYTPLERAAFSGHIECARRILQASVKCRPELNNGWPIITEILKEEYNLSQRSAIHILNWATYETQWEAAKLILDSEYHIPKRSLYLMTMQALHLNRWDILQRVFGRKFHGKQDLLAEALAITVSMRRWERIREILSMMGTGMDLEIPLVEAALDGDKQEVERLLSAHDYDEKTLNGCLLVISAGGTSESVARRMLNINNVYSHRTLSDALFLTMRGQQTEFFLLLLSKPEAAYSLRDLSRAKRILEEQMKQGECFLFETLSHYLDRFIEEKFPENV